MAQEPLGVTIAVGNQKGGVGKTTNTIHIAAALGERGYRCLIIDLDPGAGSTKNLGVNPKAYAGTLELVTTGDAPQDLALIDNLPKNVHLIPARTELAEIDKHLSKFADRTHILDRAIELARPDYDFILLDTQPFAASATTVAAYGIADWILLSALPQAMSIHGLNEALADIADVRSQRNPDLEILGLVFTAVDKRTRARAQVEEFIRDHMPQRAISTYVSQAVAINTAAEKGKTMFQIKAFRSHAVTEQYRRIAAEVVHRVTNRTAFITGELESIGEVVTTGEAPATDIPTLPALQSAESQPDPVPE